MEKFILGIYRGLLAGSCLAMLAAFGSVSLGVVARVVHWDIPGLDAYAGYAIAAGLFLALPSTLVDGEHIRVTLLLDRVPPRVRGALEWWCLWAAAALAAFMAWYALRLVWVSHSTHDVSPGADATPLWIPQLAMALGCGGFALALVHALWRRWVGRPLVAATTAAHSE